MTEKPTSKGNPIEVFLTFLKLGLTSFGGPIAHLGYFYDEIVQRRKWVSESQYTQILAICQFLPGPASSQLGFALGLMRAGWLGAFCAFLAFTLPSAMILILFASSLPYLDNAGGSAIISGLKIVAFAVVADAVWGMSKKLCPDMLRRSIAMLTVCILILTSNAWTQISMVIVGGIIGMLFCGSENQSKQDTIHVPYGKKFGSILLVLFFVLLIGLSFTPTQNALLAIADAFYQAGALVFGGGHVVLPLLEDSVVQSGWISEEKFLAGYGASQAIPGPMFAFSAYLGAIIPGEHNSWISATVALAFMFLPGFLLISAILPMWQSFSQNQNARKAIAGINAAVVGLLGAALYDPIFVSGILLESDFAIGLIGFAMLAIWKLSPVYVVLWCVTASLTHTYLGWLW